MGLCVWGLEPNHSGFEICAMDGKFRECLSYHIAIEEVFKLIKGVLLWRQCAMLRNTLKSNPTLFPSTSVPPPAVPPYLYGTSTKF